MQRAKSIAFHTLGCKLNFSETSALSRMVENEGFIKREFDQGADIYVINTCSVTDNADKECRLLVRRIQKKTPGATVVITGCYAQLKPKEIAAISGVDLVLGAAEKFNLPTHLRELTKDPSGGAKVYACDIEDINGFNSSYSINDRTRAFLKVQDGCDYTCAFCTIPLARGHSRSNSMHGVLKNVTELAQTGTKEIVLTGVNLGDFGKGDKGGKQRESSFYELVQALDETPIAIGGIERFRISSIEPNLLSDDIIKFVAGSKKFMPHFHIPLQSGSNRILGLMRRRYLRELYAERVALIKELMPHCSIGADVITGFPSESDKDFMETFDFLHGLDISYLHVFTYSERSNTPALDIKPIVPVNIRNERTKALRNLSYQKLQYFTQQHAGTTRKVLFEKAGKHTMMDGYTDNYIKVQTPYNAELVNEIVDWKL